MSACPFEKGSPPASIFDTLRRVTISARSEEELLDAFRRGEPDAITALLERYEPVVYRFGVRMCRDPEDAKDVLQDTLLAAARGARAYRGGAALSTWLYTIARRMCTKRRRSRADEREESVPLDGDEARSVPSGSRAPDEAAADREIADALDAAIRDLDPAQREVLVLRDVEGLEASEVAEVLEISVDAVKSRLHRARAAVRAAVAPLLGEWEAPTGASCPDVVAALSRHLEGDIAAADCAEMEQHVLGCAACGARCDKLRATLSLCRASATRGEVPPGVQRQVRAAMRQLLAAPA